MGEAQFHPIYVKSRSLEVTNHVEIPVVSEKCKTGSLSVTVLQILNKPIFFPQIFKISLKLPKHPTTRWLEPFKEVIERYPKTENGDHPAHGSTTENW